MRVLLDTVTFIWSLRSPDLISRHSFSILENDSTVRELSSISVTEIAIKHSAKKLDLDRSAVLDGLRDLRVRVLPYSEQHACRLFDVAVHHKDPFDRQIIAQALSENIPVVTPDTNFTQYRGLRTIW
ncbi:MAG TPA: type II toxin-antitoxin system VapC family toxin [Candidatus Acidoferrales bacterium]|jgi:PIN domain nuclease of toxin-antitoxin system|nr:type II toxin-antitoxin system VapC family toxin [Candidatus Acidoferrales bacterium]